MQNLLLIVLAGLFLGCENREMMMVASTTDKLPKVLEEEGVKIRYMENTTDRATLIDQIYLEILNENEHLNTLDSEVDELLNKKVTIKNEVNDYLRKNESYYKDVDQLIGAIHDPEVKTHLTGYVVESKSEYMSIKKIQENNVARADSLSRIVRDYELMIKVLMTLSELREYQKRMIPSQEPVETLLEDHKLVIAKEKEIIGSAF